LPVLTQVRGLLGGPGARRGCGSPRVLKSTGVIQQEE